MSETHREGYSVLDSHQHFWRLSRGDYAWLTPNMSALYRDFEPEDLLPFLKDTGVGQTILVQAAATVEETRFLLDLAHAHEFIAGVVGWIDFESATAPDVLARLCADEKLVGIRPMIQDIPDPSWMLEPTLAPAFEALIEQDLVFDALIRPEHLPILLRLTERYPELSIVIDHAAKPAIATGAFDVWATDLEALARETSARCKVSGLVTEAGVADHRVIAPYVEHVLGCFGAARVMWGSDWPVCEIVCTYREWFELSEQLLARLSSSERAQVFGDVARRTYGIATEARRDAH
jgi:L-fuconolactonase